MIVYDSLPGRDELNERARPKAPAMPEATDAHRAVGRQLRMIHDAHRRELAAIRAIVDRIEADGLGRDGTGDDLAGAIDGMGMARDLRLFGALCGRECQHLQFHHDIEEGHTFPIMEARGGEGLRAVIAKLREEHHVVHALIGALAERGEAFLRGPDARRLAALREVLDRLDAVVASHFGYEEAELEEALGVHRAL